MSRRRPRKRGYAQAQAEDGLTRRERRTHREMAVIARRYNDTKAQP